jgi:hypothetical protein
MTESFAILDDRKIGKGARGREVEGREGECPREAESQESQAAGTEEKSNHRRPNRQKDQTPEARLLNRRMTDWGRRVRCDPMNRRRPGKTERSAAWRGYRPRPAALRGEETSGAGEGSLAGTSVQWPRDRRNANRRRGCPTERRGRFLSGQALKGTTPRVHPVETYRGDQRGSKAPKSFEKAGGQRDPGR